MKRLTMAVAACAMVLMTAGAAHADLGETYESAMAEAKEMAAARTDDGYDAARKHLEKRAEAALATDEEHAERVAAVLLSQAAYFEHQRTSPDYETSYRLAARSLELWPEAREGNIWHNAAFAALGSGRTFIALNYASNAVLLMPDVAAPRYIRAIAAYEAIAAGAKRGDGDAAVLERSEILYTDSEYLISQNGESAPRMLFFNGYARYLLAQADIDAKRKKELLRTAFDRLETVENPGPEITNLLEAIREDLVKKE